VFNTNTFTTNNHLDRRVHGIHDKHINQQHSQVAKSLPSLGYAWPSSPFHLEGHQIPSLHEADFLNNIDKGDNDLVKLDKDFGSLNNLIKSAEDMNMDGEVTYPIINTDRVVRVYSAGEENFVIPKDNCNRDSVNIQHILW
jgi:hypothetical protein